ncbi:MAG: hypothetical protein NZ533_02270 [Casimicrobiaceae bacterium]|nr:hypothetical protein [Casimicrobiaceae bacterium]
MKTGKAPGPYAPPARLGLLRVGDAPLVIGTDGFARDVLAMLGEGARLEFIEFVGADPVAVVEALDRAFRRPCPVCIRSFGEGEAEALLAACFKALERGRCEVGRPPRVTRWDAETVTVDNVFWLREAARDPFGRLRSWLESAALNQQGPPEQRVRLLVPWTWPEDEAARRARTQLLERHPEVLQRLARLPSRDETDRAAIALELDAPSRRKLEAARRELLSLLRPERARVPRPDPARGR